MKKILKILIAPLGIIIFVVAILLLSSEMKNYSYQQILDTLKAIPSFRIVFALVLALLYYLTLGGYDVVAFKYINISLKFTKIVFTCFISNALGNNTGYSMLFGGSIRYRLYSLYNISMLNVTKVLFFSSATIWLGLLTIGGIIFTIYPVEFNDSKFFFHSSLPLGIIFLTTVTLYILFSLFESKPIKMFNKWFITFPNIKITLCQVLLSSADWIIASSTLFVLLPAGEISYITLLEIFLVAQMLGILSQVPGGMGVFETAIVMMLPQATESSYVMGALLAYRAIFYFFPLGIALLLLISSEFFRAKKRFKIFARFYSRRMASLIPQALSISVFIGGAIILFSGVTDVSSSIIHKLDKYISQVILDSLHFAISAIGITLLFISRGLALRIKRAYKIAIALLYLLFPLALINGYGYEKIIFLLVLLSLVILAKKYFYRNLSLIAMKLSILWFFIVLAVFILSTWLCFFVYRSDFYSINKFISVLFSASDSGRALRVCIGILITIIIVIIAETWKRYRYKQSHIDLENINKISQESSYVYGKYAFENKSLFSMNTASYIMFSRVNDNAIVFGDPVGDNRMGKELIWDFKEMTDLKNINPIFVYLGYKNLKIYDDIGLNIASFGVDANVYLEKFSQNLNSISDIKALSEELESFGYSFEIVDKKVFIENRKYIGFIDYQWEKYFGNLKNKMFDVSFNVANKYIIVKKDNFISAYAYLLLSNNKFEVFVSNVRYSIDCDNKILQYILFKSIAWAKLNEYRWFNLGLTPSDEVIIDDEFNKKAKIFVFAEHFKYNMVELRNFKSKFNPLWKKKYVAFYTGKHIIYSVKDFLYIYS